MQCNSGPYNYDETLIKEKRYRERTTKMIPEIRNPRYNQRIKDLDLINVVQRRLS